MSVHTIRVKYRPSCSRALMGRWNRAWIACAGHPAEFAWDTKAEAVRDARGVCETLVHNGHRARLIVYDRHGKPLYEAKYRPVRAQPEKGESR